MASITYCHCSGQLSNSSGVNSDFKHDHIFQMQQQQHLQQLQQQLHLQHQLQQAMQPQLGNSNQSSLGLPMPRPSIPSINQLNPNLNLANIPPHILHQQLQQLQHHFQQQHALQVQMKKSAAPGLGSTTSTSNLMPNGNNMNAMGANSSQAKSSRNANEGGKSSTSTAKIALPPWLQAMGEKRHSDKQLASGADLSKVLPLFRTSYLTHMK
jgi:hypothetical protein